MGYLAYEAVHFLIDAGCLRRLAPMRWLLRHHLRHHYGNVNGDFGVTTPIWDRLFDTQR